MSAHMELLSWGQLPKIKVSQIRTFHQTKGGRLTTFSASVMDHFHGCVLHMKPGSYLGCKDHADAFPRKWISKPVYFKLPKIFKHNPVELKMGKSLWVLAFWMPLCYSLVCYNPEWVPGIRRCLNARGLSSWFFTYPQLFSGSTSCWWNLLHMAKQSYEFMPWK